MIRRAPKPDRGFQILEHDIARDKRLSLKARGLHHLILSYPDDWRTDHQSLARLCKEGTTAIRSALKELREAGYILQTRRQNERGHWITETVVHDRPQAGNASPQVVPSVGNGHSVDGHSGGPHLYGESDGEPYEDVLEWPPPPSSAGRAEFQDWRTQDRELFRSLVGDTMTSDGSRWTKGEHDADLWYDAFRKHETKPIKWPGQYFATIEDRGGLYEHLAAYGISPAA